MKYIYKIILLSMLTTFCGCGSIMNYHVWTDGPRIYGGTYIDIKGYHWDSERLALIDLPFSFIVDTITLPILIGFEIVSSLD